MRIEKVISWLIRQIPDRFFDVLSGTECAEIDGIAHDGLLHDTEHKTAYPVAGRGFRKVDKALLMEWSPPISCATVGR